MKIIPQQFEVTGWEVAVLCHALADSIGLTENQKPVGDLDPKALETAKELYNQFVKS